MRTLILASTLSVAITLFGCERQRDSTTPASPAAGVSVGATRNGNHDHKPGEQHEGDRAQEDDKQIGGHGGPVIELGTTTVGGTAVRATRDRGDLKPGGDAPIDVWIDGGLGDAAAVRFWIGTQDAKGSIKAKAEVEEGRWHTHTEAPDPLPVASKLWVEIEGKDGTKTVVSFDLQP